MLLSLILLIVISIILNFFDLMLTNLSTYIIISIFVASALLLMFQGIIAILKRIKNPILNFILVIVSIVVIFFSIYFSYFVFAFSYDPEHLVERDNKKFSASVRSFLQVEIYYYDYVNPFIKGKKLRLYENVGNGGYDPYKLNPYDSEYTPNYITIFYIYDNPTSNEYDKTNGRVYEPINIKVDGRETKEIVPMSRTYYDEDGHVTKEQTFEQEHIDLEYPEE